MAAKWFRTGFASLLLFAFGCTPKQAQVPAPAPAPATVSPQPKQNLIVLLPEADAKPTGITITNAAGTQTLNQPYGAVRVERPDTAPTSFAIDEAEVRRRFGSILDAVPAPEVVFTLYFAGDANVLSVESQAEIPAILKAIRERRSTSISVIGHTDTTASPQYNYQLGLRRAEGVAAILRANGVDSSALLIASHGETDLAVKTLQGVSERLNRRVVVTVR